MTPDLSGQLEYASLPVPPYLSHLLTTGRCRATDQESGHLQIKDGVSQREIV